MSIAQKTTSIPLKQGKLRLQPLTEAAWHSFTAKGNVAESHYLVVTFKATKDAVNAQNTPKSGIEFIRYLAPKTYVVKLEKTLNIAALQNLNIKYIGSIDATSKIDHVLTKKEGKIKILVKLYENRHQKIENTLIAFGNIHFHPDLSKANTIHFETTKEQLPKIAALPFVEYIQAATQPQLLVNDNAAIHGATYLQHPTGLNLNGNGVIVGIGDGGTVNTHLDLNARHLNREATDDSQHASLVTGIIAGDGTMNYRKAGLAQQAHVVAEYFGNIISKTGEYVSNYGMSLTNHSYANGWEGDFCDNSGNYDIFSQEIDQMVVDFPKVLSFIAAGNSGGATCSPYPFSYKSVLNGIQSAKNVLTVGASTEADVIWSNSSRGPASDGRLKPEIVAVGVNTGGTSTTNNYLTGSGTSFAAPTVTGSAALLTQLYRQQHNDSLPEAALLKALLCNSADDLGNKGPDYIYGFGRLNARKAASIITQKAYFSDSLAQGQEKSFQITIPSGIERLKVLLAWTDPAASPLSTQSLVNNLDIEIESPNANIHYPWLLDTSATQVNQPAFRASASQRDSINNVEQISIETPAAGIYTIKIKGTNIPMGQQPFHVVYEMQEKELVLTHPLGGEIAIPADDLRITWNDATGFAGDSLQLYYSLNAGTNWTQIGANFAADRTQYIFTMPDTVSNQVQIRITNLAGTFADTSGLFTTMRRPALTATPDCDGTVALTWAAVTDASQYELYQYINDAWTLIHTTADLSYTVDNLNIGEEYCFSAKARSATGVESGFAIGKCVVTFGNPISSYPYQEDFETDAGNWFSLGKNNDWEWGEPNNTLLNAAADGNRAWVTDLDSNYTDASLGYLYSPCFDLSNLTSPVFSFSLWLDVEEDTSSVFDYLQLQYSENGLSWTRLGSNGGGYHWYNNMGGANVWDGTTSHWQQARYPIPSTGGKVRFRFLLNSDRFTNQEGVGLDNIYIYDAAGEEHFVQLQAKVALSGAYNSNTTSMHDSLRQQNHIPLQQPYASLFGHTGNENISDPNILNTSGNNAIVDWIFLELRDASDPANILATRAALLQKDGDIVDTDGNSSVKFYGIEANDFHIAVKYRNHLGVMAEVVIELSNILLGQ